MQELIKVTHNAHGEQVVSARDLHEYLQIKSKFADWIKNRIEKYGFVENQDFVIFSKVLEKGRPEVDYALTLDAAKELAMVEGNERGKSARQYFIECERVLKQQSAAAVTTPLLPQTYAEALRALAAEVERKEFLEKENAKLLPKAEFTDLVLRSDTTLTTTTVASQLGMSAKALNRILCERGIQYKHHDHYILYSAYQGKGYADLRTHVSTGSEGVIKTRHYMVWTERGRAFIQSLLNEKLSFSKAARQQQRKEGGHVNA